MSDQEVLDRYGEVAHKVSPSDYQQAARDAFGRLSQADREEFGRMLAGQAQNKGLDLPGPTRSQGQGFGDVDWLSNITGQLHQQPGLLRDLLGGLTGSRWKRRFRRHLQQPPCEGRSGRYCCHAREKGAGRGQVIQRHGVLKKNGY